MICSGEHMVTTEWRRNVLIIQIIVLLRILMTRLLEKLTTNQYHK